MKKFKVLNLKSYFVRRFFRIYPTYLFAVILTGAIIFFNTNSPNWYSEILPKFTLISFIEQFLIFNFSGIYYNAAWWSLQIEILFYILVPLVIIITRKNSFKLNIYIELSLVICITILIQLLTTYFFSNFYSLTNRRLQLVKVVDYIPAFYFGYMIAKHELTIRFTFFTFTLGLLFIFLVTMYPPFVHMGFSLIYGSIVNFLFLKPAFRTKLETWLLIWIGERSFSIFLIHFTAFYFVNYSIAWFIDGRSFLYGLISRLLGIILSLFLSMLLFYFVEKKFAYGLISSDNFWPWKKHKK